MHGQWINGWRDVWIIDHLRDEWMGGEMPIDERINICMMDGWRNIWIMNE